MPSQTTICLEVRGGGDVITLHYSYTPMLYVLKLNSHAQKEMLSHSLSGHITHCNNYLEPLLLEQLCMRECGKTVLAIGVETLM